MWARGCQLLGSGLVSKQKSQYETKVWDSVLLITTTNKKYFFFASTDCINKTVKAFWRAELSLPSFCLHILVYRTKRNLWLACFFLEAFLGVEFLLQSKVISNIQCKSTLKLDINSIITVFMYLIYYFQRFWMSSVKWLPYRNSLCCNPCPVWLWTEENEHCCCHWYATVMVWF